MSETQQSQRGPSILLWLLTINLGIALGAGLYESRVVVSDWPDVPPPQWPNTGVRFWAYVTTVPLTLLTILNGVAAWRDRSSRRQPWLTSVGISVAERAATFGYFIPTMVGLMGRQSLDPDVLASLNQWMTVNYGRHLLTFAAWMFALRALSMPVAATVDARQGVEAQAKEEGKPEVVKKFA